MSHVNQSSLTSQGLQSFVSQSTPSTPAFQAVGTQISSPFAYQINNSFHLPQQMVVPDNQPFEMKFLTRYIQICAGWRNGYGRSPNGKSLSAPLDLCLVHKEQHLYYNIVNNRQQLSSPSHVHYHIDVNCVKLRYPDFNPQAVQIPPDVRMQLQPAHQIMQLSDILGYYKFRINDKTQSQSVPDCLLLLTVVESNSVPLHYITLFHNVIEIFLIHTIIIKYFKYTWL